MKKMTNLTHRFLIFILFLPTIVFGQKKYKFDYREHLTSQQSTFTTHTTDTLLDTNRGVLTFQILDKNGEAIPCTNITIKNVETDTIVRSDLNGFVSVSLTSETYSLSIFNLQFTPITLDNFIINENRETTIKTSLGKSNTLRIARIYSRRKLSNEEVEKLVDDLSNDRENNELIKNKTCYVMWEI